MIYDLSREGRRFGATGRPNMMVMDVRSGYIYATATTSANVAGYSAIRQPWGMYNLNDAAAAKVVEKLVPDITAIFTTLYQRAN